MIEIIRMAVLTPQDAVIEYFKPTGVSSRDRIVVGLRGNYLASGFVRKLLEPCEKEGREVPTSLNLRRSKFCSKTLASWFEMRLGVR